MAVTVLNLEKAYEIIAGQPEEKDMGGARHGGIGARLLIRVGSYVEANRLGGVYGPATSFLQRRGRVTYNALKFQFHLNDDQLAALTNELLYAHPQVVDDARHGLR
jgi:hypothetical protein